MNRNSQLDLLQRLNRRETGSYKRWNVVPNTTTVASYHFTTQSIELSEVDSATFRAAHTGNVALRHKVMVPLVHEVRHWLDHTCSLWGQTQLCMGYDAQHARLANNPSELWRIAAYRQRLRDDRFAEYYTVIENASSSEGKKHWIYQLTAGLRFDEGGRLDEAHPILFTRFYWLDGTPACRAPISVAALLETAAVDFEFRTEGGFIATLPESEQQPAFESLQRKFLHSVYEPHLVEYAVAVHAVANVVKAKSIPKSYELSSALASLCLNLTAEHILQLKTPAAFEHWGGKNSAFLRNADRGYVFLALVHLAPKAPVNDVTGWLEETLRNAGLPSLAEIKSDVVCAMRGLRANHFLGRFDEFRDRQLETGLMLFEELGPILPYKQVFARLTKGDLPLPPILLGQDLTLAWNGSIQEWDSSEIYSQMDKMDSTYGQFDEFLNACGV